MLWPKIVQTKAKDYGEHLLERILEEAVKRHQKASMPQPATGVAEYFGVSIGPAV